MHTETVSYVQQGYQIQEEKNGCTIPQMVANEVVTRGNLPSHLSPLIQQRFERYPFREYLYPGAEETLAELAKDENGSEHQVVIWTQGDPDYQLWKIHTSGLTRLRKVLPRGKKDKFRVTASRNKIDELPQLLSRFADAGIDDVIVVDDKASNIADVSEIGTLSGDCRPRVHPIWINQGRTKNRVPDGYTLETFLNQFTTIEDIRDLKTVKTQFIAPHQKVAWLIDFDHTLGNTQAQKDNLFLDIASRVDIASQNILPPEVVFSVNSEYSHAIRNGSLTPLTDGMSGSQIVKVANGDITFVVKANQKEPHKIRREIKGRQRLRDIGYDGMILPSLHDDPNKRQGPFIILPYYEGTQLRHAMRDHEFDDRICLAVTSSLLDIKKRLWSDQEKAKPHEGYNSMQRTEWPDTLERLDHSIQLLGTYFGINPEDIYNLPLVSKDHEGINLRDAIVSVDRFLSTNPPYTVIAHNDASGGNILVSPQRSDFILIDCEWAGPADPAEAFVRMIKHESTTTVSEIIEGNLSQGGNSLNIAFNASIPDASIQAQSQGLSRTQEFSDALGDPDFSRRVKLYLAGSYIREIALTPQRIDDIRMILFPIIKFIQSLQV